MPVHDRRPLALADLIDRLRSQPDSDEAVKRITP